KMIERGKGRRRIAAAADDQPRRGQGIDRLKLTDERQRDIEDRALVTDSQSLAAVMGAPLEKADITRVMADPDQAMTARPAEALEIRAEGIDHIDNRGTPGRQELAKEQRLGEEIIFDALMVVHMVAGEIGVGGSGQRKSVQAVLREPMARSLAGHV